VERKIVKIHNQIVRINLNQSQNKSKSNMTSFRNGGIVHHSSIERGGGGARNNKKGQGNMTAAEV
jgi:hypothetical protein